MTTLHGKLLAALAFALGIHTASAGDIIYVKATGSNTSPFDSEATAATNVYNALSAVTAERNRIKIVGKIQYEPKTALNLVNVEVFADGWTSAEWKGLAAGSVPRVVLGDGAFVHGIKLNSWRATGGVTLTNLPIIIWT